MSSLHSALKALAPCDWSDIPQDPDELDPFLADLFSQAQTVIESIPIPDPEPSHRHRAQTTGSIASSASEIRPSSARSPPPPSEYAALQKEWGKPIKLSAKENPLGISVYKASSKDGKGSWFARRSVHEGLGFSRFKRGFEREFPTSLAVQGAPGEGNIRGIGADQKVEEIGVPNRGKVEVYRLSAQFPGPTTPRDFVTLLVTSSKALKQHDDSHELPPRHYMIISKPCNHPETQPGNGFIRGQYESVEFIREIPRKLKTSTSSTDLSHLGRHEESLEKEVSKQSAEKHQTSDHLHDNQHLQVDTHGSLGRDLSPGRKRGATVSAALSSSPTPHSNQQYDPEDHPVEWIMVTRSDPGGSVPRFMVERGTPGSICADALKFLDWACQREEADDFLDNSPSRPHGHRKESFASWEANGTLAGVREHEEASTPKAEAVDSERLLPSSSGLVATVAETLKHNTPQVVKDHIPNFPPLTSPASEATPAESQHSQSNEDQDNDDASSTVSTLSFASADSHLTSHVTSDEDPSISSKSLSENTTESQLVSQHDKELAKLAERKAALDSKFAQQREKLSSQASKHHEKEHEAVQKAHVKHAKELKKHEEKYEKEVAKLEQKKKKQAKKLAEKQRKQSEKDEKVRLTRERDEARAEVEILKKEQEIFTRQIGELQKENTALMAHIGKLESGLTPDGGGGGGLSPLRLRALTVGHENRNRSSSILNRLKNKSESGNEGL
ncbi:hypothetical protein PV08_05427 [Exophiala spinifera]|uniref:DUF3074 domain-containing protein n=1 Tax=Exophiala spinifera TaxID=91928 RepID=A0A0D1YK73_9EURO|nr:uncharacterized protein PV08_05427 [Exophiala spinifera]KIW15381.1 hypothetical protein PV08_05427 [Exophiala spinifera]